MTMALELATLVTRLARSAGGAGRARRVLRCVDELGAAAAVRGLAGAAVHRLAEGGARHVRRRGRLRRRPRRRRRPLPRRRRTHRLGAVARRRDPAAGRAGQRLGAARAGRRRFRALAPLERLPAVVEAGAGRRQGRRPGLVQGTGQDEANAVVVVSVLARVALPAPPERPLILDEVWAAVEAHHPPIAMVRCCATASSTVAAPASRSSRSSSRCRPRPCGWRASGCGAWPPSPTGSG